VSGMATREERAFWNRLLALVESIDDRLAHIEHFLPEPQGEIAVIPAEEVERYRDRQRKAAEYHAQMQKLQEERDKLL